MLIAIFVAFAAGALWFHYTKPGKAELAAMEARIAKTLADIKAKL